MSKILSFLGGWKGYAAVAVIAALIAAGSASYLTALPYRLTIAKMERDAAQGERDDAVAGLAQFQKTAAGINAAALSFTNLQNDLDGKFAVISKDFRNAIASRPLPAGCVPDAFRVQSLAAAVAAANSAAGRPAGPAVPPAK